MVFRRTYPRCGVKGMRFWRAKSGKGEGGLKLDATTDRPLEFAYIWENCRRKEGKIARSDRLGDEWGLEDVR